QTRRPPRARRRSSRARPHPAPRTGRQPAARGDLPADAHRDEGPAGAPGLDQPGASRPRPAQRPGDGERPRQRRGASAGGGGADARRGIPAVGAGHAAGEPQDRAPSPLRARRVDRLQRAHQQHAPRPRTATAIAAAHGGRSMSTAPQRDTSWPSLEEVLGDIRALLQRSEDLVCLAHKDADAYGTFTTLVRDRTLAIQSGHRLQRLLVTVNRGGGNNIHYGGGGADPGRFRNVTAYESALGLAVDLAAQCTHLAWVARTSFKSR